MTTDQTNNRKAVENSDRITQLFGFLIKLPTAQLCSLQQNAYTSENGFFRSSQSPSVPCFCTMVLLPKVIRCLKQLPAKKLRGLLVLSK